MIVLSTLSIRVTNMVIKIIKNVFWMNIVILRTHQYPIIENKKKKSKNKLKFLFLGTSCIIRKKGTSVRLHNQIYLNEI